MAKVFIVGGAGKIGRRLARQLAERGHEALAMHRKPEQAAELSGLGANPVAGDLLELDTDGLAALMDGCDAVVFTAGSGGKGGKEMTNAVDGDGLEKSVAAAKRAGISRFLLVSAFIDGSSDAGSRSETFPNYMRVKRLADAHLVASDLDWVILRPGGLTDPEGTGKVSLDVALAAVGKITRDDVAATLVEIIDKPEVNHVILELLEGEESIGDALNRIARR